MSDDRLENKTKLAILRMQFIDGIKETDYYKDTVKGLIEHIKEFPEQYKRNYVIYYDFDENNTFYGPQRECRHNTVVISRIRELNFDRGYEIESEEYY